ncbi:zonadhesin-like [Culicoides brevitarsis]|uniref:zonadhesin-like n=1 Tax=Culicoides brevitarsis TaxID=469753 RepID=UPI00307C4B8D
MIRKGNFRLTIALCVFLSAVVAQDIKPPCVTSETSETRCETITTDTTCPKGFVLRHLNEEETDCVLNENEIKCSELFAYNGTSCVYSETICAEGFEFDSDTNECVVTSTVCPENFYWNGETCEILNLGRCAPMYEFDDATQRCMLRQKICLPPYDWDEKLWKCVKHEYICPNGFKANSYGKCEQVEIVCPIGFEKRGSSCYKIEAVCPGNLTFNGTFCVPSINCPDNYVQRGSICVRDLHECPVNFQWDGKTCVLKAICPVGYELDDSTDKCVKTETKCEKIIINNGTCTDTEGNCNTTITRCPDGFKLIDGRCVCRVGMISPNGTCIWDGTTDNCPPGYVHKDGKCQPDYECPYGFEKVNGVCRKRVCPPGHVLVNGICQRRGSCFDGSIYVEGVGCVDCPPGTFRIGDYCYKNGTFCGEGGFGCESDNITTCGYGFRWDGTNCVPLCSSGLVYKDGLCVRYCHQGILLPNGTCIECPPGFVFNGETCVRRYCGPGFTISPEGECIPACKIGEILQNGVCVPVTPKCPDGYIFRDNRCQPLCPGPNYKYENGRCVPIGGEISCGDGFVQHGNTCVPIVCPEGYELVGNTCLPKQKCPSGYEWSNGRCVPISCGPGMVFRNGRCEYVDFKCGTDSDYIDGKCVPKTCPPGFAKDHEGKCRWVGQPTCPPGFERGNDGTCRWIPTCPDGFIFQNGQCMKVTPDCPTGYRRDDTGNCVPIVCPPGTYLVNNVCMKFHCPPGFFYENNECHPITSEEIVSTTTQKPGKSNCTSTSTGRTCLDSHGGTSHINNYNVIEHPTNITVLNVNHVGVYLGRCKNGQIKTVVISGNGTQQVDCEEEKHENDVITNEILGEDGKFDGNVSSYDENAEDQQQTKCCNVISPRVCEKRDDEWVCFNRKRFRCGSFCTAKTVVLSPSRRDCHGCIGGGGYRCVHECYKQMNLCETRDCAQYDYDSFCSSHGSGICW